MLLPIYIYNHPVLRRDAKHIEIGTDVSKLVSNMFETMNNAGGCGLAAPQVGESLRLFIVKYVDEEDKVFEKVFINPEVVVHDSETCSYEEGCLSIPGVLVPIDRIEDVTVTYFDSNWQKHTEKYSGFIARIIQHEHDHLVSKLITDYAKEALKPTIQRELKSIEKGIFEASYPVFPK